MNDRNDEMWKGIAEKEDKPVHELMHEVLEDMDADNQREEARLKEPSAALQFILHVISLNDDPANPMPRPDRIVSVMRVSVHSDLAVTEKTLSARAIKPDGSLGVVFVNLMATRATRHHPGDFDCIAFWHEADDKELDPLFPDSETR